MKDFQIGQTVYIILNILEPEIRQCNILKKFESTQRYKVSYDLRQKFPDLLKNYPDKNPIREIFYKDNEIYSSYEEAYRVGIARFDHTIEQTKKQKEQYIKDNYQK